MPGFYSTEEGLERTRSRELDILPLRMRSKTSRLIQIRRPNGDLRFAKSTCSSE